MRRFFSLFIVLLLIFRGLLGDAMAMGDAVMQPAQAPAADHAMAAAGHGGHDAHESDASHAHGGGPRPACDTQASSACDPAHGASCAACGICHSAVALSALSLAGAAAAPGIRPAGISPRFASALALQAVKPPIS
jgi:hypothetical protein